VVTRNYIGAIDE